MTDTENLVVESARKFLLGVLDPNLLGRQIYHGFDFASAQWAFGALDETGFRVRSLYGLYTVLLGIATEPARPQIENELRKLEEQRATERLAAEQRLSEEQLERAETERQAVAKTALLFRRFSLGLAVLVMLAVGVGVYAWWWCFSRYCFLKWHGMCILKRRR